MPRKRYSLVAVLNEARALERVDGRWKQRHAAAVAGCSVAAFRKLNCPRRHEPRPGQRNDHTLYYLPAEVRQWLADRDSLSTRS